MAAQIRRARREDVPAIVALLVDDVLGAGREQVPADGQDLPEGYWRAFAAVDDDPGNLLVVAEAQGEVVGTLQLTFIPGLSRGGGLRAQVEAVRVSSSVRGGGLGRELMGWAIAEARARGCRIVQLTSDKRRTDAHRFYASLGFEATHEGMKLTL